jgi:hypothetical protein
MSIEAQQTQSPSKLPPYQRRIMLYPFQWVGLILLLLIPLVALAGVFDRREQTVETSSGDLRLEVTFLTHNRFKMPGDVSITVENQGTAPLDTITVTISRDYIDTFADINIAPQVNSIDAENYVVQLSDLQPGQAQVVEFEYLGEKYGAHSGTITAQAGNGPVLQVNIETFVFP